VWENFWSEVVWVISRISAEEMFEGNVRDNIRGNDRIPMQDYKSVCVAVMICANTVSTHTHTDKDSQTVFDQLYY